MELDPSAEFFTFSAGQQTFKADFRLIEILPSDFRRQHFFGDGGRIRPTSIFLSTSEAYTLVKATEYAT
jgi:hypothetical protein